MAHPTNQQTDLAEQTLDDILWGADEIRRYLRMSPRKFNHYKNQMPIRKLGKSLYASKSELRWFLLEKERKIEDRQKES